jgi:hypothetical protein
MLTMHEVTPFLTADAAATLLVMPTSWVYAECRKFTRTKGREGIPCKRFGRAVRIPGDAFLRWLETR